MTGLVDCGHVSGLYVRSDRPLAQMGCADRVPNIVAMSEHHRVPRGVPLLGSTDRHLAAFLASARSGSHGEPASGRLWLAVSFAAHHHGPQDAGHLVGQRDRRELFRLAREQSQEPRRGAAPLGLLDDRGGAKHEPPPQVLVARPGDPARPVFAGRGVLARGDADPGGKVPARAKGFCVRYPRFREGRLLRAKLTPPIGPMPGIVARPWLV